MKSIKTLATLTLGVALGTNLLGTTVAADGETLFKQRTCFTCHGADGKTPIMAGYPKIAGQDAAYTLIQMQDIKSGARSNGMSAAMKGVMHLVTDEEMQVLADYIATLQP